jgi:IS1 family transposase
MQYSPPCPCKIDSIEMPPKVPSEDFLHDVFHDEEKCIDYLIEKGIILREIQCCHCNGRMTLRRAIKAYRCTTGRCRKEKSIRENSFFSKSKLPLRKIMRLGYLWLIKTPITSIISAIGCGAHTVTNFMGYFRQLVEEDLEDDDSIVGGNGIIVGIDECKLGKRKYNRGHRVEGIWILGGVERTPARKVFLVEVPDRSAETLSSIIVRCVASGSVVMTDLWRGYHNLESEHGYIHLTVNHSKEFINDKNGCCTNTIEGTWNGLKLSMKPRQRTSDIAPGHLIEFIWRRKNSADLWGGLLGALRGVGYINS